jgi:transposase
MKLSERKYVCQSCGLTIDRDVNAAKNILAIGLYSLGVHALKAYNFKS